MAVGAGWQTAVAYVNIACYYIFGVPLGLTLGFALDLGVKVCVSSNLHHPITAWSSLTRFYVFYWKCKRIYKNGECCKHWIASFNLILQGIWCGMLTGTVVQTCVLVGMIYRTNWSKEVRKFKQSIILWYRTKLQRLHLTWIVCIWLQASIAEERIKKWGGDIVSEEKNMLQDNDDNNS